MIFEAVEGVGGQVAAHERDISNVRKLHFGSRSKKE